jgi:hypothetical protein
MNYSELEKAFNAFDPKLGKKLVEIQKWKDEAKTVEERKQADKALEVLSTQVASIVTKKTKIDWVKAAKIGFKILEAATSVSK